MAFEHASEGARTSGFSAGGTEQAAPDSELRWLYIDFNSYFASVEQQLQPRLRGKPVAVVPVDTDSTCAIAASYEAKAFGVRTGTPIYEARKMCPGLICVLAQHEAYVDFHHRILAEIERHLPVSAVCSIDEAASRLMDNEASEGAVTRISHSIKKGLARNIGEYVRCSIGVGPNRYLAKVATDLQKPDGLTILRRHDLPERLFSLKLRDLPGVGYNMERRLRAAAITDLPGLWALNVTQMRAVWGGVWGERMWHLLRGADVPEPPSQRRSIGHSHVMAPELRDPLKARHVARRLTMKAASRLRRMGYYASAFAFSARFENGAGYKDGARCWRAQDSMTFLLMLEQIWSRLLERARGARIKKVSVVLYDLVACKDIQPDLFDPDLAFRSAAAQSQRAKAERVSRALDQINRRFGRDTIILGAPPSQVKAFSGTKVAFTRIPDREEFLE